MGAKKFRKHSISQEGSVVKTFWFIDGEWREMRRKTREVRVDANFLSLNFYVLLAVSSQLSMFLKLCHEHLCALSVMSVMSWSQERILGSSAYPLARLNQKVLSRLAEYDDVIIGPPFQPCLGPPNSKTTTVGILRHSPFTNCNNYMAFQVVKYFMNLPSL